jgi:hypothetical protein
MANGREEGWSRNVSSSNVISVVGVDDKDGCRLRDRADGIPSLSLSDARILLTRCMDVCCAGEGWDGVWETGDDGRMAELDVLSVRRMFDGLDASVLGRRRNVGEGASGVEDGRIMIGDE